MTVELPRTRLRTRDSPISKGCEDEKFSCALSPFPELEPAQPRPATRYSCESVAIMPILRKWPTRTHTIDRLPCIRDLSVDTVSLLAVECIILRAAVPHPAKKSESQKDFRLIPVAERIPFECTRGRREQPLRHIGRAESVKVELQTWTAHLLFTDHSLNQSFQSFGRTASWSLLP